MRASRVLALSLALATLLPVSFADNEECNKLYDEGLGHYQKGEYAEALPLLRKALAADPTSLRAQLSVGLSLHAMRKWDEAQPELEKVAKMESPQGETTAIALCAIGIGHGMKGDWDKAIASLRESVRIKDNEPRSWMELTKALEFAGRFDEAVEAAKKVLALNPDHPGGKEALQEVTQKAAEAKEKRVTFEIAHALPSLGGCAVSQDLKTLYVSVPSKGELAVFDTAAKTEPRHVALDFQPGALVWQGKLLYAAAVGASKVYALDPETGKAQKTFKLPGNELVHLACNQKKGLLYGVGANGEVVSIDPGSGKVTATQARGTLLAVDPANGRFVFTAGPGLEKGADPARTALRKYSVQGADLKLVETNANAAASGACLQLSPDGKRVVVAGSGGWRGPKEAADTGGSVLAFFDAESINTAAGRIEASGKPVSVLFHPLIDTAVVAGDAGLARFGSKTLVLGKSWPFAFPVGGEGGPVAFAAGGTRVVCWLPGDPAKKKDGTLGLVPLELSPEETEALEKALGGKK